MDVISFSEAATANSRIDIINANPDSSSGVVTVPSTIATGETITIPAGRTAVLPDVLVEGDLLVDGTVFIPTGSTYTQETIKTEAISNVAGSTVVNVTDVVSRVGNQTIAGVKTFSTSPVVPTPTTGDNSTKVATTAFCTSQDIGVGQTLQTFTVGTTRVAGTTYTNSTGKPINLIIGMSAGAGATLSITAGGALRIASTPDNGSQTRVMVMVMNAETYSATSSVGTINYWAEIR